MPANKANPLQTEFSFTLPKGYVDAQGNIHREGVMRLATGLDEIAPLRDPRVKSNQAYLTIVILARVITRLGTLTEVNTNVVESLFTADLAYLQDFYRQINSAGDNLMAVTCPECSHAFQVEMNAPGGSVSYPLDDLFEEVAFIAYHLHWSLAEIFDLEHGDRQRFIDEVSAINREMNEGPAPAKGIPLQDWV